MDVSSSTTSTDLLDTISKLCLFRRPKAYSGKTHHGRTSGRRGAPGEAAPPAPGGRGTELRPACGGVGGGPQLGLRGGRAEAPGRGAHLRRQGAWAVVRPQMRGAAAREPKASARGAARGKRAAAQLEATTTTRAITGWAVAAPGEAKQRSRSDGCFAGGGRAFPVEAKLRSRSDGCFAGGGRASPGRRPFPGGPLAGRRGRWVVEAPGRGALVRARRVADGGARTRCA